MRARLSFAAAMALRARRALLPRGVAAAESSALKSEKTGGVAETDRTATMV